MKQLCMNCGQPESSHPVSPELQCAGFTPQIDPLEKVLSLLITRQRNYGFPHVGMKDMVEILNTAGLFERYKSTVDAYYKELNSDKGIF